MLETGDAQAGAVRNALERLGYEAVRITRDLADRERVVEGRKPAGRDAT